MHRIAIGTPAQFVLLDAMVEKWAARKRFEEAATEEFGPVKAALLFKLVDIDLGKDLAKEKQIDDLTTERVEGDTATLVVPRLDRTNIDTTLRKIEGEWRVELDSLEKYATPAWLFLADNRGDRDTFYGAMAIYIRNHNYPDYETAGSAFPILDLRFRSSESPRFDNAKPRGKGQTRRN